MIHDAGAVFEMESGTTPRNAYRSCFEPRIGSGSESSPAALIAGVTEWILPRFHLSGQYGHYIRTLLACQAPMPGNFPAYVRRDLGIATKKCVIVAMVAVKPADLS